MSDSPEDIIELTDIIEHGPGVPKKEGAGEGVDLSFERELEDLFAESPPEKAARDAAGLPGLDELNLPDDAAKAEGEDIDLDGLDALLADAEKSQPTGMDLPELEDDFLKQTAQEPVMAAPQVSGEAVDALNARLDALEEKVSSLGDSLAASFKSMLDEALAGLRAEIPAPREPSPDPAPMIEEARQGLEERIEALRADIPGPVDEETLAERIKGEILSAMPAPAEAAPGAEALLEEAAARMETRLAAFKDELSGGAPSMAEEAAARLEGKIDAVQSRIDAIQADASSLVDELAARLEQRISAVETQGASPAAPDLSGLASKDELAALRQDILAEIRKAVPAAAAQVIREEIQALLREAD